MRILLVEDDETLVSFIASGLREAGFEVEHAYDGETGLHKALTESYNSAIIDIMLPKLDGLTLIEDYSINLFCYWVRKQLNAFCLDQAYPIPTILLCSPPFPVSQCNRLACGPISPKGSRYPNAGLARAQGCPSPRAESIHEPSWWTRSDMHL